MMILLRSMNVIWDIFYYIPSMDTCLIQLTCERLGVSSIIPCQIEGKLSRLPDPVQTVTYSDFHTKEKLTALNSTRGELSARKSCLLFRFNLTESSRNTKCSS